MVVEANNDANLGELTHRTEWLVDVIGAVQSTVNQLNQFLVQATRQGIQLLPTLARPTQQASGPRSGGNKGSQKQADESQIELAGCWLHQRGRSPSPPRHRGDIRQGNDARGDLPPRPWAEPKGSEQRGETRARMAPRTDSVRSEQRGCR